MSDLYFKSDVVLLADIFQKPIKVSNKEFNNNPLHRFSLPGYTWQCGLKFTIIRLQTLQDKDLILLLENSIRRCICSVMGDRYVQSKQNKKTLHQNA